MLATLRRWLIAPLVDRLDALERAEAVRSAEHTAMVDQLDRLYKRMSTRIAREHSYASTNGAESILGQPGSQESVLSLRERVRRR